MIFMKKTRSAMPRRLSGLTLYVELLEMRTLLNATPNGALLLQLQPGAGATGLAQLARDNHATLTLTTIPGLFAARGTAADLARLSAGSAGRPDVQYVQPEQTLHIDVEANDPQYANGTQWGLNGANGIRANAAWNTTSGSTTVTVADIDTGMDYNHPDLYKNVWINQAEIPASRRANLTDVDHDGLMTFWDLNLPINQGPGKITDINGDGRIDGSDILAPMTLNANGLDTGSGGWADNKSQDGDTAHPDDLIGWNFVNNTNNPIDDHGHGTHTAGTIAAMGNNGVGGTGVEWVGQVMALKFLDASGSGSNVAAAEAIRYAADHGARVSNNSWGGAGNDPVLSAAISYAGSKGDIFVAAAGNSSANADTSPNYPSGFPLANIIAVAALTADGLLAGFSNYGATTVDVGAPGVGIYSTLPNNSYGSWSGTSMATPHVTGTVAMVLGLHPAWTVSQVINQILSTVTPVPALAGKTVSGGIVNAAAAVAPFGQAATGSASFVRLDAATQGSWRGAYGADGYAIAGDATAYPSYAQVAFSGQSSFTWAASTADVRALQKAANSADRVAACWYSGGSFTVDLNLTDGQVHQVAAYAADWDSNGARRELVQVVDAGTGAVLDSRDLSSFGGGAYLVWQLKGHVQLRFTNESPGSNAVLNGLFFGAASPAGSASFVKVDAARHGSWRGADAPGAATLGARPTDANSGAPMTMVGPSEGGTPTFVAPGPVSPWDLALIGVVNERRRPHF
jgi:subtilisin family serine protease